MKSGIEKIELDDFLEASSKTATNNSSSSESKSLLAHDDNQKNESSDDVEMRDESNPLQQKAPFKSSRFAVSPAINSVAFASQLDQRIHHSTPPPPSSHHQHHSSELTFDDHSDLLLRYVRENRLNKVRELFDLRRDAGQILSDENLNYNSVSSTRSNYLKQVQVRFDINVLDEYKQTPLHIATRLNFHEIAALLVEEGAKVNESDADNWSPLHNCAKNGNADLARILIEKKASIDAKDTANFTPLMWACYKNRLECVKLLLKSNANPNAQCKNSICCLSWACGRGYVEIVNELLDSRNIKVNLQDQNSSTPLLWAARKGNLNIVKALLQKEADPNLAGMYAITPLIASIKFGHSEIAMYLASLSNVNLNHIDKDGNTALQISCKNGYENVVLSLLEKGAYINTPNLKGDSILITAVKGGHKQIIDELLNRHVAIDQAGNQGKTAMYHAVEKGNFEIVKTLLMYKPDLEIETHEGDY
jgi:ankyrin repeat protein